MQAPQKLSQSARRTESDPVRTLNKDEDRDQEGAGEVRKCLANWQAEAEAVSMKHCNPKIKIHTALESIKKPQARTPS